MSEFEEDIIPINGDPNSSLNTPDNFIDTLKCLFNYIREIDWEKTRETISLIGDVISLIDKKYIAREKLSEHQLIYFGAIPNSILEDIINSTKPDLVLYAHLENNNFKDIDILIEKSKLKIKEYKSQNLYSQSVSAYRRMHYSLACIGFTTILDSLLSSVTKCDKTITNFNCRLKMIYSKQTIDNTFKSGELDVIISSLMLQNVMKEFTTTSNFNATEPDFLNRHWISHGRSSREYSQLDSIKLLGMIYSILIIDYVGKSNNE